MTDGVCSFYDEIVQINSLLCCTLTRSLKHFWHYKNDDVMHNKISIKEAVFIIHGVLSLQS